MTQPGLRRRSRTLARRCWRCCSQVFARPHWRRCERPSSRPTARCFWLCTPPNELLSFRHLFFTVAPGFSGLCLLRLSAWIFGPFLDPQIFAQFLFSLHFFGRGCCLRFLRLTQKSGGSFPILSKDPSFQKTAKHPAETAGY